MSMAEARLPCFCGIGIGGSNGGDFFPHHSLRLCMVPVVEESSVYHT